LPVSIPPARGVVWNDGDGFFRAHRQQVALKTTKQHVVSRLNRRDPRKVLQFAAPNRSGDLVGGPVGNVDVTGLAGPHDGVERLKRLVDRRQPVVVV
jgi:hypothetical protein